MKKILGLFIFLFSFLFLGNICFGALTDGLQSYWKLDESAGNAADSVGGITLTNTNVTYAAGKINNGSVLNGSNGYLENTDGTAINNMPAGTISLRVKRDSIDHVDSFVDKLEPGVSNQIQFMYEGIGGIGDNMVRFRINDQTLASIAAVTDTTNWIFWVGTWSSAGMQLYKNGVLDNSNSLNAQLPNKGDPINFGQVNSQFILGNIDEISVYNRVLSSGEISQLFNSGAGLSRPFTGNVPPVVTTGYSNFFYFF